jgi:hypothetical protein
VPGTCTSSLGVTNQPGAEQGNATPNKCELVSLRVLSCIKLPAALAVSWTMMALHRRGSWISTELSEPHCQNTGREVFVAFSQASNTSKV